MHLYLGLNVDVILKLITTFTLFTVTSSSDAITWTQRSVVNETVQSTKQILPTVSPVTCARECVRQDGSCFSFSYDADEKMCYLDPIFINGTSGQLHYRKDCSSLKGYVYMPDGVSCIKVILTPMNVTDAWDACRREGARLLHMKDETKRDQLRQVLTELGIYGSYQFWADASDFREDGVYLWGDGTAVNQLLFASNEPSNRDGEDCMRIKKNLDLADTECFWVGCSVICEQY